VEEEECNGAMEVGTQQTKAIKVGSLLVEVAKVGR
jgi:hypothetical protein